MAAAAAEAAGLEEIDLDQNLLELGLDSLRAAEFASQACTHLLVSLDPAQCRVAWYSPAYITALVSRLVGVPSDGQSHSATCSMCHVVPFPQ